MSRAVCEAPRSSTLPERTYNPADLARMLGVKRVTVLNWARRGILPPGRRFGLRVLRWTEADIKPLLAERGG
jgi:predicted DNA-binding transcriptional regulator AlpA